jgi:DNA polymerase sigma
MNILSNEGFSQDIEFINANCPILRGICVNTGFNFDICFNKRSGLKAVELVKNVVDNNAIIKQAVIFIKILLKIKNLNETFTGGMCSFLVFHLVYYFYTVYISKNKIDKNCYNKNKDCDNNSFSKKKSEKNILNNKTIDINEQEQINLDEINTKSSDINSEENTIFNNDIKIGDFLIAFFKFYGFEFDYKHYGFSLNE